MEQAKEIVSLEVRMQGDVYHLGTMNSVLVLQGEREEWVRGHHSRSKLGTGSSVKLVHVDTLYLEVIC